MEDVGRDVMFGDVYSGRKVLVTGHTGFKGSWLVTWLHHLGAEVAGYSIDLPSKPCNFEVLELEKHIRHVQGDVRDRAGLQEVFSSFQPEIVFHLAAQSLVRRAYDEPVLTFETNMMGTMNLLECVRQTPCVKAAAIITSDKCYRNVEWEWGYRERDELGGDDPYSASKAGAELIAAAYMRSYLTGDDAPWIATTRAGNVIGGGDWAADRLVPDAVRAWSSDQVLTIRHPHATRPWQHVLEPLSGYLWLASALWRRDDAVRNTAFNFGPRPEVNQTVEGLLNEMVQRWPGSEWTASSPDVNKHESTLLSLNCDRARNRLNWHAILDFEKTVELTAEWYRSFYEGPADLWKLTLNQIDTYSELARHQGLVWVR